MGTAAFPEQALSPDAVLGMEDPVLACAVEGNVLLGGRTSCCRVCLETGQSNRMWWKNLPYGSKDGLRERLNVMSRAVINMGGSGHLGGLYVDRLCWHRWIPHIPPAPCSDKREKDEEPNYKQWVVMFGSSSCVIRPWWLITVLALGCWSLFWVLAMN